MCAGAAALLLLLVSAYVCAVGSHTLLSGLGDVPVAACVAGYEGQNGSVVVWADVATHSRDGAGGALLFSPRWVTFFAGGGSGHPLAEASDGPLEAARSGPPAPPQMVVLRIGEARWLARVWARGGVGGGDASEMMLTRAEDVAAGGWSVAIGRSGLCVVYSARSGCCGDGLSVAGAAAGRLNVLGGVGSGEGTGNLLSPLRVVSGEPEDVVVFVPLRPRVCEPEASAVRALSVLVAVGTTHVASGGNLHLEVVAASWALLSVNSPPVTRLWSDPAWCVGLVRLAVSTARASGWNKWAALDGGATYDAVVGGLFVVCRTYVEVCGGTADALACIAFAGYVGCVCVRRRLVTLRSLLRGPSAPLHYRWATAVDVVDSVLMPWAVSDAVVTPALGAFLAGVPGVRDVAWGVVWVAAAMVAVVCEL